MNLSREDIARISARVGNPNVMCVGKPSTLRRGRGVRRQPGTMNKTEASYARHLEALAARGDISWFRFEGLTFKLAKDTRYTPDFVVMTRDGLMECHEVKGFFEEDAKVKIKVAAEMFPFTFWLVRAKPQKDGGGFEITEVAP
jgi:hypothetical protein